MQDYYVASQQRVASVNLVGDLAVFPTEILTNIGENCTTQTLARLCTVNSYFYCTFHHLTYIHGALDCKDPRPSRNPAVWAIRNHRVLTLARFLQHGLRGNTWVWINSYPTTNILEESLLHLAIKSWKAIELKDLSIIKLLLGHGADANGLDMKFDTPLSLATYSDWGKNMKGLVRLLLEFGAKLTINDGGTIHNRPPLLWAARHGDVEVVGILLKYGADTSVVDGHGFTAFQLAKQEGHEKVMKLLEFHENSSTMPIPMDVGVLQ